MNQSGRDAGWSLGQQDAAAGLGAQQLSGGGGADCLLLAQHGLVDGAGLSPQ